MSKEPPTSHVGREHHKNRRPFFKTLAVTLLATLSLGVAGTAAAAPPKAGDYSGPLDSKSYRLTSAYGPRCQPIMYASTFHRGQDMGAKMGDPIYAIADGKVVRAQADRTAGQWILIEHVISGTKWYSSISHTTDANKFVKVGQKVRAGQKVAEVGTTGVSTGPHLHLEIWKDAWYTGTSVDPEKWLKQRGIDIRKHASAVTQRPTPSTCTYYAYGNTPIYASASTGSRLLTVVPNGTLMTAVPKDKSNGFIQLQANGVNGWAHESNVSPTKPPANLGGVGTTTANVNMRKGPGTSHAVITVLPYGTKIDQVLGTTNGWSQVKAKGKTGWVSNAYLSLASTGSNYGFFLANSFKANADIVFSYGDYNDEFFVGDWDGDGKDTIAYRRGNTFYIRNSNTAGNPEKVINYGRPGDVILVGDWNGDGIDTFAVRRGSEYHFKNSISSGPADRVINYGRKNDEVYAGDWNGSGTDTLSVRRGKTYYVKNSLNGGDADKVIHYGREGDTVLVGDWDGDGDDTFAVRRGKVYHVKNSISGGNADIVQSYGRVNDSVYVGDWNGDGKDTLGVHRKP